MNKNLPALSILVKNEFLFNQTKGHGETTPGWLVGVRSVKGLALQFYCLLETGALFTGLPIHALATLPDAPKWDISKHQLWNNLSFDIDVVSFDFIKDMECQVLLKDKTTEVGNYLFTVDYIHRSANEVNTSLTHTPNEWKSAHIILLHNGNFVAYPPNRILFKDASLVDPNTNAKYLGYKVNTHIWAADEAEKWSVGDSDEFFY